MSSTEPVRQEDSSARARSVLITGANSGIGLAAALELARRGYDVVGTVRSRAKADVVSAAADRVGVPVRTALLDVTDPDQCEAVIAELPDLFAVVNNAGYTGVGAVEDVSDKAAREQLETMVLAPMRLARLATPVLRQRQEGRIVNVTSIYAVWTTPLTGWYQAVKHAVEALSDALRVELARDRVKVVVVRPGGIRTNIWSAVEAEVAGWIGSRFEAAYQRLVAIERLAQRVMLRPEAVATAIAEAVSSRSPRPYYVVGLDAHALATIQAGLPAPVRDVIYRRLLGL